MIELLPEELSVMEAAFVAAYSETGDPCRAYKTACGASFMGLDSDARKMGEMFLRQPRISQALRRMKHEIEEAAKQICGVDKPWVMSELKDLYTQAKADQKYTPAISCLQLLGKEIGMFVDRKHETKQISLDNLSKEDMVAMLRQLNAEVADYQDVTPISEIAHQPKDDL